MSLARVVLTPSVRQENEPSFANGLVDAEGRFVFTGCAPAAHVLSVRDADGRTLARATDVFPGEQELTISLAPDSGERAPLVVEVEAPPSLQVSLLEVRGPLLDSFLLRDVGDGTHFTSEPLSAGVYRITALCPVLGTCDLGRVQHDPARASTHRLRIPAPGRLSIDLVAPRGVDGSELSIAVTTEGLSRDVVARSDGTLVRELVRDPVRGAWEIDLFPGDYWPRIGGAHVATRSELVSVRSGETSSHTIELENGVPVKVRVEMARGLHDGEQLTLEVVTPRGTRRSPLAIVRRLAVNELEWNLPPDATRLVLSSDRGLVGTLDLPIGALDAADDVPSFVLRPEQR